MLNQLQRKNLEKQVHSMLYSSFSVNGNEYYVTDFEITDIKLVLKTSTKEFNILHANVARMLDMFIPIAGRHAGAAETIDITPPEEYVHEEPELSPAPEIKGETVDGGPKIEALSAAGEIRNILMDNIRKLQRDKTYIHQAEAINDSVKTLISFAKTEIEAKELSFKMSQGMNAPKLKQLT